MRLPALLALSLALADAAAPAASAASAPALQIRTLSNRADLVSDGNALVAISVPRGADAKQLDVTVGGRDVSGAFTHRVGARVEGLVSGLALGPNDLVASAPGATAARLTITNHPNGGPVFSGPQVQPWFCQKSAVDAQCNQPPVFTY